MSKKTIIAIVILFAIAVAAVTLAIVSKNNREVNVDNTINQVETANKVDTTNTVKASGTDEAMSLIEKYSIISIEVDTSKSDIDELKRKIETIEFVKSVEKTTTENINNEFENRFSGYLNGMNIDLPVKNLLNVSFKVNSVEDLTQIKALISTLEQLDGVDSIRSDRCVEIFKVYEKTGINGLKEYDNLQIAFDRDGVVGAQKYLTEHPQARIILKDFIHF